MTNDLTTYSFAQLKSIVTSMFREKFGFKKIKKVFPLIGDLRRKESWINLFDYLLDLESSPNEVKARPYHELNYFVKEIEGKFSISNEDFLGNYKASIAIYNEVYRKWENLGTIVFNSIYQKWCFSGNNVFVASVKECISNKITFLQRQKEKQALGVA